MALNLNSHFRGICVNTKLLYKETIPKELLKITMDSLATMKSSATIDGKRRKCIEAVLLLEEELGIKLTKKIL